MRRVVLYDPDASAAARVALALRERYQVYPLGSEMAGRPSEVPAVVLADGARPASVPPGPVRVVALVDGAAEVENADRWYALLPRDADPRLVERAVANAFAELDADAEIRRLGQELSQLHTVAVRLGAERDPDALLELILTTARALTGSDAGSLYLVEEHDTGERGLVFVRAQNDSVPVPFETERLGLDATSVAGWVALTGRTVNLADAYAVPAGAPFRINRTFDDRTGYRTRSMLVVPLRTPAGEVVGVLQLINGKLGWTGSLRDHHAVDRYVRPFTPRHQVLAEVLAAQAAVAVENDRLSRSIRRLFDGFVSAAVTAIESRDPATSGHSFRVAELAVALAEAVSRCDRGPYASVRFSADELRELRYAALLHDFGKVAVREAVLLKARKLDEVELERIRHRVALLQRDAELEALRRKLAYLLRVGRRSFATFAARLDARVARRWGELETALRAVERANAPALLPGEAAATLRRLASRRYRDARGRTVSVITPEQAAVLAIPRGSLTEAEVQEIRAHVTHTVQFLSRIPWTRELRRVPEIAGLHHEKLDGSGYPAGLRGEQIPLPARILTIADIYDALTAGDRPYKAAVPAEYALAILEAERCTGAIDGDLFDLFVAARVYTRTAPGEDHGQSSPAGQRSHGGRRPAELPS